MAKVPVYDNMNVNVSPSPVGAFSTGLSVEAGALQGKQQQQLGQGMMQGASELGRIALDMQNEANQLRVDDAINQAKERALTLTYDKDVGLLNQKGIAALERKSGKPLADEYAENYKQQLDEISKGLGNDAQRMVFGKQSRQLTEQLYGTAMRHESEQFVNYANSVREGQIANSLNSIGLNWNNPTIVDEETQRIKAAATAQGRLLGKSAEWIEANTRKLTSNAHMTAIGSAIEKDDIIYADAYLKKYSKDMDANDILKVRGLIGKQMDVGLATNAVSAAMNNFAPKFATSDGDRAYNILLGAESNNQMFDKDGKVMTSKKGAIGIAQVMPTTGPEAAKLAGLPWDEQKFKTDVNYNMALGRAYFDKQLKDFDGNLDQAYAAYNAGPQATKDAIAKSKSKGGNYLLYLPRETQDYVSKNLQAYSAGQGQYEKPTLKQVIDAVDAQLPNANPQVLQIAREEAGRQFKLIESDVTARKEAGTNSAISALMSNGGNFNTLPISVRGAIPAEDLDKVLTFAKKVSGGERDTNLAIYQKLSDPVYLNKLTDQEFYRTHLELSDSDWKRFAQQRAITRTGKGANGAQDIPTGAISSSVENSLSQLGMLKDVKKQEERYGAITRFVTDTIMEAQMANGKKFTDLQVREHVNALFAKNYNFRNTFLGFEGSLQTKPRLTMEVGDIPADTRKALTDDLTRRLGTKPTEGQLLQGYFAFTKRREQLGQ